MRLAPYATKASSGRFHAVSPDPYRSDFRRDIGRVLYSKAFRRLAFKTQVFSPMEGDHWRNRLTHSLECAQIARVAAEALELNAELAEAIALAHDLGHPPFGHQGERVLNELMAPFGGFDHNLQNLRVVMLLETQHGGTRGLNLTFDTLVGIGKSAGAKSFLRDSNDLEESICRAGGEAVLADWADDLAYSAADFDDYARYHRLEENDLAGLDLALLRRAWPQGVIGEYLLPVLVRNVVSLLVNDLIEATKARVAANKRSLKREEFAEVLAPSPVIGREWAELRAFLRERMYADMNLKAEAEHGAASLRKLFIAEKRRRDLRDDDRDGHLELCDYLSGMSDHYALEALTRLTEAVDD